MLVFVVFTIEVLRTPATDDMTQKKYSPCSNFSTYVPRTFVNRYNAAIRINRCVMPAPLAIQDPAKTSSCRTMLFEMQIYYQPQCYILTLIKIVKLECSSTHACGLLYVRVCIFFELRTR
jgi:hypothetical protein